MMVQNKPGDTAIFLVVGKLRRPHGLRGEMIMDVITDFPERLWSGVQVFVGEQHIEHKIRTRRRYGEDLLLSLDGYENPEQAGVLRNELVYVRSDMIPPLPAGEYYQHQLLGLRVVSDEGQELGHLEQIMETGANDIYLVRCQNGAELLLPVIDQVILNVDLQKGEIRVHLLPGLLPD